MKEKILESKIVIVLIIILVIAIGSFVFDLKNKQVLLDEVETEETITDGTYSEKLEEVLNKAVNDNNVVKESVLNDLIKRNDAGDYSLDTAINIIGYPICVLESYDLSTVNVYYENDEIEDVLNKISTNTKYTKDSFLQLYWMSDNGQTIITWIALNEDNIEDVKIIGVIQSQYEDLDTLNIPETTLTSKDLKDSKITKTEFINTYSPYLYQVQNKLLDCNFISNLMDIDENSYTWEEYVLKTNDSYLFIDFKDDEFYLSYELFITNENLEAYSKDILDNIKNGITEDEFLEKCPDARFSENYYADETTTYHCYTIVSVDDKDTVLYYNFENGILSDNTLEDNEVTITNSNSTNK